MSDRDHPPSSRFYAPSAVVLANPQECPGVYHAQAFKRLYECTLLRAPRAGRGDLQPPLGVGVGQASKALERHPRFAHMYQRHCQ